jgi:hypothetical protein
VDKREALGRLVVSVWSAKTHKEIGDLLEEFVKVISESNRTLTKVSVFGDFISFLTSEMFLFLLCLRADKFSVFGGSVETVDKSAVVMIYVSDLLFHFMLYHLDLFMPNMLSSVLRTHIRIPAHKLHCVNGDLLRRLGTMIDAKQGQT